MVVPAVLRCDCHTSRTSLSNHLAAFQESHFQARRLLVFNSTAWRIGKKPGALACRPDLFYCRILSSTVDHLMLALDLMRPPALARGPALTSLCRWIVFVVDYLSGAVLSHSNVFSILIYPFAHTLRNVLETQASKIGNNEIGAIAGTVMVL